MNKDFEEWKDGYDFNHLHTNIYDLFQELISSLCRQLTELNDKTSIGLMFDSFSDKAKIIYEAGQQSAKPRWIPVTEQLPTEKDGIFIDEENSAIDVLCKTDKGTKIVAVYRFSDKQFFYDTKITNDMLNITNNIAEWQPL